ncbi:MAG: hypothetical protein WDM84_05930 [Bauldia sp.]
MAKLPPGPFGGLNVYVIVTSAEVAQGLCTVDNVVHVTAPASLDIGSPNLTAEATNYVFSNQCGSGLAPSQSTMSYTTHCAPGTLQQGLACVQTCSPGFAPAGKQCVESSNSNLVNPLAGGQASARLSGHVASGYRPVARSRDLADPNCDTEWCDPSRCAKFGAIINPFRRAIGMHSTRSTKCQRCLRRARSLDQEAGGSRLQSGLDRIYERATSPPAIG